MKLIDLNEYQYGSDLIEPTEDPEGKFRRDPIDFRGAAAVGANGRTPSDVNHDVNTNEPDGYDDFVVSAEENEETISGEFMPRDDSVARQLAMQFMKISHKKGNPYIAEKLAKNFYKKIIAHINNPPV